jgi:hypothetical protein
MLVGLPDKLAVSTPLSPKKTVKLLLIPMSLLRASGSHEAQEQKRNTSLNSKRHHIGPSLTTFRINTCKSVSKQSTLTTFRINTCEKHSGGGLQAPNEVLWHTMPKRSKLQEI